ncbi:MAG: LPS export ABC transporter periplasmic protein LptC, partial [candidate division Zixibacteria bacterium]|nr:LPS export ABC transporter periplasmic protein LptC [candidate division Zixibacteria bacterium]
TKSLRWDPSLNLILTDDFVKVTRGKDIVTGYGLESDPELKHITIKKNVSGEIRDINAEEPI